LIDRLISLIDFVDEAGCGESGDWRQQITSLDGSLWSYRRRWPRGQINQQDDIDARTGVITAAHDHKTSRAGAVPDSKSTYSDVIAVRIGINSILCESV